ncbi:hypothetical protein BJY04DRAFT_221597 [Aspergillus karnatakaensis]|uniref:uncharacterized protein n=1 Tax=Aspergillus karnatakaensis TaxID=1810916 RepID=UPI003CCE1B64
MPEKFCLTFILPSVSSLLLFTAIVGCVALYERFKPKRTKFAVGVHYNGVAKLTGLPSDVASWMKVEEKKNVIEQLIAIEEAGGIITSITAHPNYEASRFSAEYGPVRSKEQLPGFRVGEMFSAKADVGELEPFRALMKAMLETL